VVFADAYRRQVTLLLRIIPFVAEEICFALKGGTAINLFIRNMPRLSVDIDLAYMPIQSWDDSLAAIDAAMKRIRDRISGAIPGAQITDGSIQGRIIRLLIRVQGAQVKIEVTPVLRGSVYGPELRTVSKAVEAEFGFAEIRVVSFPDLYGGKIVAALDRQHPRDLFDIRDLLANEGIDAALRRAFIVYVISHDRPMSEVLAPRWKDITEEFLRGFEGMTERPVSRDELIAVREALVRQVVGNMPNEHRRFLLSFKMGRPEWDLLGLLNVQDLPAVRWRQQNLEKMAPEKRVRLIAQLKKALEI
jgi:predicted nucleotidyltransferase component of viral defense system